MKEFNKVSAYLRHTKIISEHAYKRMFTYFCLSGCMMLFLLYSFALINAVLMGKELSDILAKAVILVIVIVAPLAIATTVNINTITITRIAVACLVLFIIACAVMVVFLVRYSIQSYTLDNIIDFYTIVFIFFSTLIMVVAKAFTE